MLVQPFINLAPNLKRYDRRYLTERIVIHRIALGARASDIIVAFSGGISLAAKATGYKMPYHYVVESDGSVIQTLPLDVIGPHAWKWNDRSIGVACVGDFRIHEPPKAQWYAAARLCRSLEMLYRADIWGHDELPEGSTDPQKVCPGAKWNLPFFLGAVRHMAITGADIVDFEQASVF